MNLYYVFTPEKAQQMNSYLESVRSQYPDYTVIILCPIKNDLYALPYLFFDDPIFSEIKEGAEKILADVVIRIVNDSEFLEFEPQLPPLTP